jgi:ketosteroid isomerase-like protein
MYWQPDRVEVSGSGDMGMTSGRYVQVITGAEARQGRYVVVWRRDGSGDWKILTETRIPDPPRTAAVTRR